MSHSVTQNKPSGLQTPTAPGATNQPVANSPSSPPSEIPIDGPAPQTYPPPYQAGPQSAQGKSDPTWQQPAVPQYPHSSPNQAAYSVQNGPDGHQKVPGTWSQSPAPQPISAAPTYVPNMASGGGAPINHIGCTHGDGKAIKEEFTPCGIILGIVCCPIGLLCMFAMRKSRCRICQEEV